MRQIGMRQEASRLGGIGSCGRELCCSTWLTDFKTVSTSAARYQNLSLNTLKLAGQCGKLKCCLNYELDTYMDALKTIPDHADRLKTGKGEARLQKTDIFKQIMWFTYFGEENTWIPVEVARVKEIQEMNKNGEKPDDLKDYSAFKDEVEAVEKSFDYENVVGQDSLTRLDDKARKNKNNNNKAKNKPNGNQRGEGRRNDNPNQNKPQQLAVPNKPVEGGISLETNDEKKPNPNKNRNKKRRNPNRAPEQE